MSLWQTMCREAAGAARSIGYDLGLLKTRRGKPTRRLVIAAGLLTAVVASGVGTVIAVGKALDDAPADRAPSTHEAADDVADDSEDSALSGIGKATGSHGISPSPAAPSPSRSDSPAASPTRSTPARNTPPAPTPTSPPTRSPSTSPSPSPSTSPSPPPSSSPPTSNSASPSPSAS